VSLFVSFRLVPALWRNPEPRLMRDRRNSSTDEVESKSELVDDMLRQVDTSTDAKMKKTHGGSNVEIGRVVCIPVKKFEASTSLPDKWTLYIFLDDEDEHRCGAAQETSCSVWARKEESQSASL